MRTHVYINKYTDMWIHVLCIHICIPSYIYIDIKICVSARVYLYIYINIALILRPGRICKRRAHLGDGGICKGVQANVSILGAACALCPLCGCL